MSEPNWSDYPNFSREEFECGLGTARWRAGLPSKCGCGRADMDARFMGYLQAVRTVVGQPFAINSGFRCEKHDREIGGAGNHTIGLAADIKAHGELALHILRTSHAFSAGLKQHGPHESRFIHLDMMPSTPDKPRPWIWTYA